MIPESLNQSQIASGRDDARNNEPSDAIFKIDSFLTEIRLLRRQLARPQQDSVRLITSPTPSMPAFEPQTSATAPMEDTRPGETTETTQKTQETKQKPAADRLKPKAAPLAIRQFLRDRDSLQAAWMLREILGPPRCRS